MSRPLTVRDRPWSFWSGAVMIFIGGALMMLHVLLPNRDRDVKQILFWVNMTFLVLGAIGCYRGRAARFDAATKQLRRGTTVVHDLSKARGLVVYPLGDGSPAHYVTLVIGDAQMTAGDTIDAVRGKGNFLLPIADGVPPGAAKHAAIRWRDALDVPVVLLPGCKLAL